MCVSRMIRTNTSNLKAFSNDPLKFFFHVSVIDVLLCGYGDKETKTIDLDE